ncbi:MAG TPA: CapA family protein [Clostridia bacterium]|nr:CapA family protein [Clostridia bacterium]
MDQRESEDLTPAGEGAVDGSLEGQDTGEDHEEQGDMEPIVDEPIEEPPDEPLEEPPEEPIEEPPEDIVITISLAGDCTIGTDETFTYTNSFPDRLEKVDGDWSYFFAGVVDIFENDDLTLVNLETTFTKVTKKADKRFRFKGDPSYVNILKEGSVEMVNLSNNHIYDYLQRGFDDTIETLDDAGILYSGEGYKAFYESQGITMASLGYQGWNTNIKDRVKKDIEEVRDKADIVIVSFHGGIERDNYPNSVQKELGRFAIDEGADIVAGHHPHVIQGIEEYKDKYIIYSLGNFCFGGNRNPDDKDTFIFQSQFTFTDGELKESQGNIIPCSVSSRKDVNDYQPTVLEGEEAERVMGRILKYSSKLKYGIGTDD